ncbi:phage late control D family protein [Fulvimarina sp. MAC3]|uniref:phage late control D family protein n=1 Tax=Fulvimarina sp. MAC3 TaxID=3148887 RepID=UPI0031FCB4C5
MSSAWFVLSDAIRTRQIYGHPRNWITTSIANLWAALASLKAIRFADYPVLEYTVQYGESDADFCRRLMERFGITWSFRHEDGAHILRLTDHVDAHDLIAGEGGARPYRGVDRWHPGEEEHFREWHGGTRVTTGAVRLTEYNFKTPHAAQEVDRPSPIIEDRARMKSEWGRQGIRHSRDTRRLAEGGHRSDHSCQAEPD